MFTRPVSELIRFRLIESAGHPELIIASGTDVDADAPAGHRAVGTRWLHFRLSAGGTPVKKAEVWVPDQIVRDFDLSFDGQHWVWVAEVNGLNGALLRDETPSVGITVPPFAAGRGGVADLPRQLEAAIQPGNSWHAQLPPVRWLFNPRIRSEAAGQSRLICNTLDGHLLALVGPAASAGGPPSPLLLDQDIGQRWKAAQFLPDRLFPVTLAAPYDVTAYLETSLNSNLFYSLRRYSGRLGLPGAVAPKGLLRIDTRRTRAVDLSKAFKLGPVNAFDLASSQSGQLVLSALHTRGSEYFLTLLKSTDRAVTWSRIVEMQLESFAEMISVLPGPDRIDVAYSLIEREVSTVKVIGVPW